VLSPPDPEEIKSFFAARRDWLLRTWLPAQGFVPPANEHPTIALDPPRIEGSGIRVRWAHADAEGDPATVDLYWTDRRWSHLETIPGAQGLPAEDGSFLWAVPDDRVPPGVIIHGVIRDARSDLDGHGESARLSAPAPPVFSPNGGSVPVDLRISSPDGVGAILYTLDGSDPMRRDGAISATAIPYAGPIPIDEGVRVRARVRVDFGIGLWSDLAEAAFRTPALTLAVTEIMYAPP
jgi:hypothetical protein